MLKLLIMIYRFLTIVCLLGTMISCKGHDSKDKKINNRVLDKKIINNQALKSIINLSDIWRWRSEDKSQEFTIKILKVTKDSLFAQYCAVYNNGGKLDCDFEKNINIKAKFDKNKNGYVGSFYSFFNSEEGMCFIKISDTNLTWEILKAPKGEYYAPNKCTLKKENDEIVKSFNKNPEQAKNFPVSSDNLEQTVKFNTSIDENTKNVVREKYQLTIDAIAEIPSKGDYSLYIINNVSGDSDIMYLITIKKGTLLDGLEISNSNGDNNETTVFLINSKYEISIYSQLNNKKKLIGTYSINSNGKFLKI